MFAPVAPDRVEQHTSHTARRRLSDILLAVMFCGLVSSRRLDLLRPSRRRYSPGVTQEHPRTPNFHATPTSTHLPRLVRLPASVQVRQHDFHISCLCSPKYIQRPNPRQRGRQGTSISCAVGAVAERYRGRPSHGNLCGRGQHRHAALQYRAGLSGLLCLVSEFHKIFNNRFAR